MTERGEKLSRPQEAKIRDLFLCGASFDDHVDKRTIDALARRGLVVAAQDKMLTWKWHLTASGRKLAENLCADEIAKIDAGHGEQVTTEK